MVGRRDEAPLVPPYRFLRPNKAMALHPTLGVLAWRNIVSPRGQRPRAETLAVKRDRL